MKTLSLENDTDASLWVFSAHSDELLLALEGVTFAQRKQILKAIRRAEHLASVASSRSMIGALQRELEKIRSAVG